jgi:hypothetical protein
MQLKRRQPVILQPGLRVAADLSVFSLSRPTVAAQIFVYLGISLKVLPPIAALPTPCDSGAHV